jgi:hypothetical protein
VSPTALESWSLSRKTIVAVATIAFIAAAYAALKWIRQDITYWSRSVTFTYRSDTLEQCARLVALNLSGVTVSNDGKVIALNVPGQEGVLVKPTGNAQEAWLVVFGHSPSISQRGPAAEAPVKAFLEGLRDEFARWCS